MSGGGSHNHNHNHSSTSNSNSSSHDGNDGTEGDDHQHLKVNDGSGGSQESSSSATSTTSSSTVPLLLKSPLSPKLPSRFKFSKHKSGSKSANAANLRSKSGEGETAPLLLNENGGQPSTSSAANDQPLHSGFFSRSHEKASKQANSKAKSAVANGSSRRPMLIRQQSDEHQQALQEKVRQQENGGPLSGGGKVAAKGKGDKAAGKTGSGKSAAASGSKNVGKLRKMAALGSTTNSHQPSDIVYEEGDSNKVPSVVVCLMTV